MLYDLNKSFAHHWQHGFTSIPIQTNAHIPPPHHETIIFGYTLASAIGISACPVTTATGIELLAPMGYSIFTYKTIRSTAAPAHPLPNVAYVPSTQLSHADLNKEILATPNEPSGAFGLANSFGNGCFTPKEMQEDIARAKRALSPNQLLIVSVYGSEQENRSLIDDYIYTAQLAQEAGAQAIECNLSCPNVPGAPPMYQDADLVYQIIKKMTYSIKIPISAKIGICTDATMLKNILTVCARAGAQGICTTNTIPMHILNASHKPYFGAQRTVAGISGDPIRTLALQSVANAHNIIQKEQLSLTLFGIGGITQPEHIDHFFAAGADVAMSATGIMLDPRLAINYYEYKRSPYDQERICR